MSGEHRFLKIVALLLITSVVSCNKNKQDISGPGNISVTTFLPTDITTSGAMLGVEIDADNINNISKIGICWGTTSEPTINNEHKDTNNTGEPFYYSVINLEPETEYHVRGYAICNSDYYYGDDKDFITLMDPNQHVPMIQTKPISEITLNSAQCGGLIINSGGFDIVECGICWAKHKNPTTQDYHINYNTISETFYITIDGLMEETSYHVRAYATNSIGETGYGEDVCFMTLVPSAYPNGILPGLFTISSNKKVYFSQGNLQYIGSTTAPYWKFANHQWDYFGDNGQASSSTTKKRDFFGWGTSGWDNDNVYYMPYDVKSGYDYMSLYGPPGTFGLTSIYKNSDWGVYNAIANGGNMPNQWRTLSKSEWNYLFNYRSASTINNVANARFVISYVNDRYGVILFPDVYNHPSSLTLPIKQNINNKRINTNNINRYGMSEWEQMEQAGCVFLPASGFRATQVEDVGSGGYYWSTSCCTKNGAYSIEFVVYTNGVCELNTENDQARSFGYSVRLVKEY